MIVRNILIFLIALGIYTTARAQVTEVKYFLKYDTTDCSWGAYLFIAKGNTIPATTSTRIQFNANFTIVLPAGATTSDFVTFAPYENNEIAGTGIIPSGNSWQKQPPLNAPAITPDKSYHSFAPTLSPRHHYNELNENDTIRLFKFKINTLSPTTDCFDQVRMFRNGIDPPSSQLNGANFANGFSIGGPIDRYKGNLETVLPPLTADIAQDCDNGIKINLNLEKSTCQGPYTYEWTGPGGFTSNSENIAIVSNPQAGRYSVKITDNFGCMRDTFIDVALPPSAGRDTFFCNTINSYTLRGSNAPMGTWIADVNNPSGAVVGSTVGQNANVTFNPTAQGTYNFIYESTGCEDTVSVRLQKVNAGNNPLPQDCFRDASFNMNAIGNGEWTLKSKPAGANDPTFDKNNGTTQVNNFNLSGIYVLTWKVDSCSVDITLNVGNNCVCPVDNILTYTPIVFCGTSTAFTINGNAPNPAADAFIWETSINNGADWLPAPGTNNGQNYTSTGLTTGEYLFRRRYLNASQGCDKASNQILVKVNPIPNGGDSQSDLCAEASGGMVTMNAAGNGMWDVVTSPSGSTVTNPGLNNPNATIGFSLPGTYVLSWTVDGCEDTVTVVIAASPQVGADIELLCSDPTNRMASLSSTGFGSWFAGTGNPSVATITSSGPNNANVTGLTATGVYTFNYGTPTCFDEVQVMVTNKADAGMNGELKCVGEAGATYATNATNGPGQWQLITSPLGASLGFEGSATDAVTGLKLNQIDGIFNIKWTDSDGCTDTLMVNVTTIKNSGADQTSTCQTTAANASFVMNAQGGGGWSDPGGNPGSANITNENTPSAIITGFTTPGRYTFKWTAANGCEDFTDITVRENPAAGNDTSITCIELGQGSITMNAQGDGTWTQSSNIGTATIIAPDLPTTEITGFSTPGAYFFRFSDLSGCSSNVQVDVTAKPNAGADNVSQVCVDLTTAVAQLGASGSGQWKDVTPTMGTPPLIISTADPNTRVRDFPADGTYLFEWTSGGCTDTVAVVVAGKTEAGSDTTISCVKPSDLMVTLNAKGIGRWSDIFGLQYADRTNPTTTVTNFNNTGTYILKWDVNGCEDEVFITINPPADAGANPARQDCYSDARVTLNASASVQGSWSPALTNPGLSNIASPTTFSTEVNSFKAAGTYIFIWKTIFDCEDTVSVVVGDNCLCTILGNTISTTSPLQFCKDAEPVTITAPIPKPAGGTYQWQVSINNGVYVDVPGEIGQNITTPKLSAGVYNYRRVYSNTVGFVCGDSSVPIRIVVANPPNAGGNYPLMCLPVTQLTAPLFTATPGVWRPLDGGVVAQPNVASTTVSGFTRDGRYRIELEANGCRDTMEVIVSLEAKAGDDKKIICIDDLATASFRMNAKGMGTWSKVNPTDIYTITNPTDSVTTVNGFTTPGNKILIWTTPNGCKDSVELSVTTKARAGNDIDATCVSFTPPYFTNLNAIDTGSWRAITSGINIANANARNTPIGPFTIAGTYQFEYSNLGCLDTVDVVVTEGVKINSTISGVSCFQDSTVALSASSGGGNWSAAPSNSASTIVSPTGLSTKIIGFAAAGSYKYYYTKGGCRDSVTLSVGSNCNCAITGNFVFIPLMTFCGTSSVEVRGNKASPSGGTTSWLLSKDNQAFTNATGGNDTLINLINLAPGNYRIRKVYTITTCSDTTETVFVVNPIPDAGRDTIINCVSYPFSYTASAMGTGRWSPNINASIFNLNSATTIISNINSPGTLKFYWDAGGCIDSFSLTTTQGVNAGRDTSYSCVVSTVSSQLIATGSGSWTQVGNLPSVAGIATPTSTTTAVTSLNTEGIYRFVYSNGNCTDTASITISKNANAGQDRPINCVILPYRDTLNAVGTGSWIQVSGPIAFMNAPLSPNNILDIDSAGTYVLEWTAAAGCKDTVTWTITSKSLSTIDLTSSGCNQTAILTAQSADPSGSWVKDETRSAGTFTISSTSGLTIQVSGFSAKGTYYLIKINGAGCTDTLSFAVDNRCGCQIDGNLINGTTNQFCEDQGTIRINGVSPIQSPGTYAWIFSTDSINYQPVRGSSTGLFYDNPSNAYAPGKYFFRRVYRLSVGGCVDSSNVVPINIIASPSGGINRSVACWSKEFTSFTAEPGAGYKWEFISSDPPQLKVRIVDPNLSTSRVDSFSGPGRFTFRWTNGTCESFVDVTALNLCDVPCNLTNNRINADTVTNCENLQAIFFNGPTSAPVGGQYLWQVLRNGSFVDAPGVNGIEDYRPDTLAVGQHIFRRLYQFGGCSDTSNQVVVNIIAAPNVPTLTAPATVCEGLTLSLSTTSIPGYFYRWTGPNGFISSNLAPSIPNVQVTSSGTYRLLVGNGGCFSDTAKAVVNVVKRPRTPLATNNLPICDGQILVIKVIPSIGVTYNIANNFNSITNDTIYTKINATMNDEGNYIITADSVGCKSLPLTMNIKLNRAPIAMSDRASIQCFERDSIKLTVNETSGTWSASPGNPGTVAPITGVSPTIKGFTGAGTYSFIWDNGSCRDTVTVNVGASCNCNFPTNALIQTTPDFICSPTDTIVIKGSGLTDNTINYRWETKKDSIYRLATGVNNTKDYAAGLITTSTMFRRIITLKSDSLCRDTSNAVFINVLDLKGLNIQLSNFKNPICQGDTTSIRWLNPLSFLKYRWSTSGSVGVSGRDTLPVVTLVGQNPGEGRLRLNITTVGCNTALLDTQLVVAEIPKINLGADTTICTFDQSLSQYILKAEGFATVLWNDGSTDDELVVTEEGSYSVNVTNAAGCIAEDSIFIAEFCCKINYPNIIKLTSGNDNNSFNIDHTDCVLTSTLRIYDRWGNLVFQSKDVTEKWDGTYNGVNVEQGVYVFVFEYNYIDQTGAEVKGKKAGDITVLR